MIKKLTLHLVIGIALTFSINLKAQTALEPYAEDENTVLLMHFDNHIYDEISESNANDRGTAKAYVPSINNMLGSAIHFNNNNLANECFISFAHSENLSLSGSWTIEMWFYAKNLNAGLINKAAFSWNEQNYNIHVEGDGHIEARFYDTNQNQVQLASPPGIIQINTWYHVAYINDAENNQSSITIRNESGSIIYEQSLPYNQGTTPATAETYVDIGRDFDGYIDELRISNIVREYGDAPFPEEINEELILNKVRALNLHEKPHDNPPYKPSIEVLSYTEFLAQKPNDALIFDCGFVGSNGKVYVCEPTTTEQMTFFAAIDKAALYYVCQSFLQYYYQTTEMPIWFKTGFASYEAGLEIDDTVIKNAFQSYGGNLTSFSVLNDPATFISNNGIAASYMFGEFMAVYKIWQYKMILEVNASTIIPASWWYNLENIDKLFETWMRYVDARILEADESLRVKLNRESAHFKYYYRDANAYCFPYFENLVENALDNYISLLGFEIYDKLTYITMPECKFAEIDGAECRNRYTGGTAWSSGMSTTCPDNTNDFYRFDRLVRHELGHLAGMQLPNGPLTAWINEGFATFMEEGVFTQQRIDELQVPTQEALTDATNYFGHLPTFEDTKVYPNPYFNYYLLGQIMMNFIHQEGGYEAVKNIMMDYDLGIEALGYASKEDFMSDYYSYLNTVYLKINPPDRDITPYTPDENTVLLLHLDGNLDNSSTLSDNGTTHGNSVSFSINAPQGLGQSLRLDNSNSADKNYISIPHSENLNLTGDWTIESWVYLTSTGSNLAVNPTVLSKSDLNNSNYFLWYHDSWGQIKGQFTNNADQATYVGVGNNVITTNKWFHVAYINNSETNTHSLYIRDENMQVVGENHYQYQENQSTPNTNTNDLLIGSLALIDNFYFDGYIDEVRISNIIRTFEPSEELPPLQIETEEAKLYGDPADISSLTAIQSFVDPTIKELISIWERPINNILSSAEKVKIFLVKREQLETLYQGTLPAWKCAFIDANNRSIYITEPESQEQQYFYGTFEEFVKNTLAQLVITLHFNNFGQNNIPEYFREGLGLYFCGQRPDVSNINQAITGLGRLPSIADLEAIDINNFPTGFNKDLIIANIESQKLSTRGYGYMQAFGRNDLFQNHFQYYYQNAENDRIFMRGQTANFDVYCTAQDIQYISDITSILEAKLTEYSDLFEFDTPHRYDLVIYPTVEAANHCRNITNYSLGTGNAADKFDILSPIHIGDGYQSVLDKLIPHEFLHVFHNHMFKLYYPPGGPFHGEGLAELMALGLDYQCNEHDINKIIDVFNHFETNYGREPILDDFITNYNDQTYGFYIDPYFFGAVFYRNIVNNISDFPTVRDFFLNDNDWSVYPIGYNDVQADFINHLKTLAGIINENAEYNKAFASGWNWFSVFLSHEDMSLDNLLSSLYPQDGDYIKDRSGSGNYATYHTSTGWEGTLEALDPKQTYKIKLANDGNLNYMGYMLDLDNMSINVDAGWNWIGYPIPESMPVEDFLSTLNLVNEDYLKNQIISTTYFNNHGWFGHLTQMKPGEGYMLKVTNAGSIHKPESNSLKTSENTLASLKHAFSPQQFELTGSATIAVNYKKKVQADDELYAFNKSGDCVGYAKAKWFEHGNTYLFYMMMYSDQIGEEISFKLFSSELNDWVEFDNKLSFEADMIVADVFHPYELTAKKEEAEMQKPQGLNLYPNPFIETLNIDFYVKESQNIRIVVYDGNGRMIEEVCNQEYSAGSHHQEWNASNHPEGIYYIIIEQNNSIERLKVVKVK